VLALTRFSDKKLRTVDILQEAFFKLFGNISIKKKKNKNVKTFKFTTFDEGFRFLKIPFRTNEKSFVQIIKHKRIHL